MSHADHGADPGSAKVRHFRQILLWPLQLVPLPDGTHQDDAPTLMASSPEWCEVEDEFTGEPADFQQRHYHEFVTFLPHVQRFLYGDAALRGAASGSNESPIRVFRRRDVAQMRVTYETGEAPTTFAVTHADVYFFHDVDVVVLAVEIHADGLTLARVQDTLFRFGRAYPPHWNDDGAPSSCVQKLEWLAADGRVLAMSDYDRKEKYLEFVCRYRSPCIGSHWEYLLHPLVHYRPGQPAPLAFRQLEYYRMPLMAYLALEDPSALTRADFVRLGLVAPAGESEDLPYSGRHLLHFERDYCYDRYWTSSPSGPRTRYLCCGHALTVIGDARDSYFVHNEYGVLAQFRHQQFLLFLIAHFHKAALLMMSDRLVHDLNQLDVRSFESIKRFKRAVRLTFGEFLRFSHRYWFHDIADQALVKDLFRMCSEHLGTERLYREVREEIGDMSAYLDSDSLRRQSNMVVRLTVVTIFGLIGSVTTGFLGMNLIDATQASVVVKLAYFGLVALPVALSVFYMVLRSKRLSDFIEALADERLSVAGKWKAFVRVVIRRGRWAAAAPEQAAVAAAGLLERRLRRASTAQG